MFVRCFWSLFSAFWWIGDQTHWTRYSWVGKEKNTVMYHKNLNQETSYHYQLKNELKKRQAIIVFSSPLHFSLNLKNRSWFWPFKNLPVNTSSVPKQFFEGKEPIAFVFVCFLSGTLWRGMLKLLVTLRQLHLCT